MKLLYFVLWLAGLALGTLAALLGWAAVAAVFWLVWSWLNGSLPNL